MSYGPFGAVYNGSRLLPPSAAEGAVVNVAQRTTAVQISDPNVAETDVIAYSVPAGALGLGGRISAKLSGSFTNNMNAGGSLTLRVYLGATVLGTMVLSDADLAIVSYRHELRLDFANINTTGLQLGSMFGVLQEDAVLGTPDSFVLSLAGATDSTVEQLFRVTAQLDALADMVFNVSYGHVELVRGAA
jgi:hypothetical protein